MREISAALDASFKNLTAFHSLRFTRAQLYYEVCRELKAPPGVDAHSAAVGFAAGSLLATGFAVRRKPKSAVGIFAAAALGFGGLYRLRQTAGTLAAPISIADFENALHPFLQNRGRLHNLLDRDEPENSRATQSVNALPADLQLYGLPRLLICQNLEIARMLRANNFHLETACAIFALNEVAAVGEVLPKMLCRADAPTIYFLHDASLTAESQLADLPEKLRLPDSARLKFLGLRPLHAEQLHLFRLLSCAAPFLPQKTLFQFRPILTDREKRWLISGKQVEVAAVNPVRLLRVLRRLVLDLPAAPTRLTLNLPKRELGFL